MIKRTILIGSACKLSVRESQLVVHRLEDDKVSLIPVEDIGFVEIDHQQVVLTASVLSRLGDQGAVVAFTDQRHHPNAVVMPIAGNTLHAERLRMQVEASEPCQKQLWKAIIQAKIANQADHLEMLGIESAAVRRRVVMVRSNDTSNQEGSAAQYYWKEVLRPFNVRRDPDGDHPNSILNYGYAILRACVARALVSSGLHPALGIKHSNRYNAFALADDVMEPYRPFVDAHVIPIALEFNGEIDLLPERKRKILEVLVVDCHFEGGRRPLLNAIQMSASSIVNVLSGKSAKPSYPRLCA